MLGSEVRNLFSSCLLSVATVTGLQTFNYRNQASNVLRARRDSISPPINSTVTILTPQFFTEQGSKRVKVTYGPFVVPPMNVNSGMEDFEYETVTFGCSDCTVTYMEAGLEYPNGTYANVNTSLWLHHVVLYNTDNEDTVCGTDEFGERFFASGNERSPVSLCNNGTNNTGYYVGPKDNIAFLAELMNTAMENQTAVVTMTYEYLPGLPSSFQKVTPIWLDITGCGDSEEPAKNDTTFQYTSPVWTANATGRIAAAIGHLHDGGVNLDITQNNSTMCDFEAAYGENPGYIDASAMNSVSKKNRLVNANHEYS
ncbi:hypothetical protein V8E51_008508 [Hyaloscypha variabilis]|uniref:Uncharacterized protein n=1 Tax=Hyaloscypha variabilis (strain UAMH 11265 / GT02V1 / F) TaxID=1149755 RepID=A0A2J6S1M2_HYAVF|nr:hypothetical protein L207DRAFT_579602 [Hyaloscypha variabilis F]